MQARILPVEVVAAHSALKLQATRDVEDRNMTDEDGNPLMRKAGEEWLFEGPGLRTQWIRFCFLKYFFLF